MNKHAYRIVFNRARNQIMAVAESASGHGHGTTRRVRTQSRPTTPLPCRILASTIASLFGLQVTLPAYAQIVADPNAPKTQQPTILNAANGVPVVNIQTPSAAGVSRNTYSQFDVGTPGAILNNSRIDTPTVQGGWVQGNPWLAAGTAKVILNEVNSSDPSLLRGYVEVAGDRAQVVIANPAGISCDGCGFINANRITLTTGTPVMNGGVLESYRVQGGVVKVEGSGLDASRVDFTDLIARAVEVNAGIWANTLKVTAGANLVSADHTQASPIAGSGPAPAYAIDVASLGGMYAGKIILVGTEAGVGVRNAGQIGASAGELTVTADGKLINTGTLSTAAQPLTVTARGLDNAGTLSSQADIAITSQGDVTNSGLVNAGRELKLDVSGQVTNAGTLSGQRLDLAADHLDNAGVIQQTGSQGLSISAQNITNQSGATLGRLAQDPSAPSDPGTTDPGSPTDTPSTATGGGSTTSAPAAPVILADGQITIRGDITNSGTLTGNGRVDINATGVDNRGTVNADSLSVTGERFANAGGKLTLTDLTVVATTFDNTAGQLNVANHLTIDAQDLINAQGSLLHAGSDDLAIQLNGILNNAGGTFASNANNLTISGASIDNTAGYLQHAGLGSFTLTAGQLNGTGGYVSSQGVLTLNAENAILDQGSTVASRIELTTGTLSNRGGHIAQYGSSAGSISTQASFDNTGGAVASAAALQVTAGSLDNTRGSIVSDATLSVATTQGGLTNDGGLLSAGQALTAQSAGVLSNRNGQILNAGTGPLTLAAAQLDNTLGQIQANGAAQVTAPSFANQGGILSAQGPLEVTATTVLDNSAQGLIASGNRLSVTAGQVVNAQGEMAAQGDATLTAGSLDNTRGLVFSAAGGLAVTTTGSTINDSGALLAASSVTLDNTSFSNTLAAGQTVGGVVSGSALILESHGQAANNAGGTLIASQAMNLSTGALTNDAGLIQAGSALTIDTHGQTLSNRNAGLYANSAGGIASQGTVSLQSGDLDNTAGFLGAGGAMAATTGRFTNTGGVVVGAAATNLAVTAFDNTAGQVQSLGDLTLTASGNVVNTGGLLRSGGTLALQAGSIDNHQTLGDNQGIEGRDVTLAASALNNLVGAIRADNDLSFTGSGSLDNSSGLISAGNTLTIQDIQPTPTLAITNTGGTLLAGQKLALTAGNLTGDGLLLSQGDLAVSLVSDFNNSGTVQAGHDVSLTSLGKLTNSGTLDASNTLDLRAAHIDNQASGKMSATTTRLSTPGSLTNRGLIDGGETAIDAGTVDNLGTGRIYGDHIGIAAGTVNNTNENGASPTIAARQRLDIGTTTLNNDQDALIFSAGDLAVGGGLNEYRLATGRAGTISNNGGTFQSLGAMWLVADYIANTNANFSAIATLSSTSVTTTTYNTSLGKITADQIASINDQGPWGPLLAGNGTPNASGYSTITFTFQGDTTATPVSVYSFVTETHQSLVATVLSSAPGQFLSGGDMTLDAAQTLTNDKSRIIAGGILNVIGQTINNIAAQVSGTEKHTGTSYSWGYAGHDGASTGHHCNCDVYAFIASPYLTNVAVTVDSPISVVADHQAPGSSGSVPGQSSAASIGAADGTGAVRAVNAATQSSGALLDAANGNSASGVTPTPAATGNAPGGPVVRSVPVDLKVPATSLYSINPGANSHVLVATDPRFANYQTWLSSDYMLQALSYDPATTQKRLGDGFYEQQLIREQIGELTGQRFLQGYASDEAEYNALMDAGITYAKQWNLQPGIALTPAQIAQLTSDIVWLVSQTVTLPDGTTQEVLVPQVYLRPRAGDLDGSGTLLAGSSVHLNASGDFTNSGTVAGRTIVDLSAQNVQNLGGRIAGGTVSVQAVNDLNNIGGRIEAIDNLLVTAGRDINVITTTVSGDGQVGGSSFSRTQVDRVAGLYVTGDQGLLVAQAGQDINLAGAEVKNAGGDTVLKAGRDLMLGTVTTSDSADVEYSNRNYAKFGQSTEIGTTIQSGGDVALVAGRDIGIRAGQVEVQGDLTLVAEGNITLAAGRNEQTVDESSYVKSKQNGATHTRTLEIQANSSIASGTQLSGQNVTIEAGGTLASEGARIAADQNLAVKAQDIVLDAAYDTASASTSLNDISKSKPKQHSEQTESTTATGSVLVAGGNLSLTSRADTTVIGSALAAGGVVNIETGGNLALLAAQSGSHSQLYDFQQGRTKAVTHTQEETQTRMLLSTITAGGGLSIDVGGDFQAQLGETNADGSVKADRMTATGVEQGDSRQQVSITSSGNGNGGDLAQTARNALAAVGVRSGANDVFTPGATASGEDALRQFLQSGLVSVGQNPQLTQQLQATLGDGAGLTVQDAAGKISLTVAGQAKVQEVYNTLKLTENFDVKKFPDAGTAQLVTLVVAVALTVCTAGVGATLVGAAAGTLQAAVANAAFIAMTSTMVGQLAGGASFDQAFEAGVKAGVTSAVMAGVSFGVSDALGLNPQYDADGNVMKDADGKVIYQTADGAKYANSTALEKLGNSNWWIQAGAKAAASGVVAAANGGSFQQGFTGSMVGSLTASGAGVIGDKFSGPNDTLFNVAGHAVVGCVGAAASGKDCASGAEGAAAGSIIGRAIDSTVQNSNLSDTTQQTLIAGGSTVGGALAASALGGDALVGGNAAATETINNALSHLQATRLMDKLQACAGETQCLNNAVYNAILLSNGQGSSIDQANARSAITVLAQLAGDPTIPLTDANRQAIAILAGKNVIDYATPLPPADPNAGTAWTSNGPVPVLNGTPSNQSNWNTGDYSAGLQSQPGSSATDALIGVGKGILEVGKAAQESLAGGAYDPVSVPSIFPAGTVEAPDSHGGASDVTTPSNQTQADYKPIGVGVGIVGTVVGPSVAGKVVEVVETVSAENILTKEISQLAQEAEMANAQLPKLTETVGDAAYTAPTHTSPNTFQTHGLTVDQVPQSIQNQMTSDLQATFGVSAQTKMEEIISSGISVPIPAQATSDTVLYRVQPVGEIFNSRSVYYMDANQLTLIEQNPALINDVLGLPPGSTATTFNIFERQPLPGQTPTIYQSNVATSTTNSGSIASGAGTQTILPNGSLWTPPQLVGQITIKP